jgi:hypothetical protein
MRYVFLAHERRLIFVPLILAAITSILLFMTCSDNDVPVKSSQNKSTALLVSISPCKENNKVPTVIGASFCTQDCLQYWFDSSRTMHIKHINAAYNCCMESLMISYEIKGPVVLVSEIDNADSSSLCKCLCLHDVEYEIRDLPATVNKIEIVEPYALIDNISGEKPLCCSFVYPKPDTLTCCVERCHYPWMINPAPFISVINDPVCKSHNSDELVAQECAEWELAENALIMKHTNTLFNCCADSITASMEIHGDTIYINEWELGGEPCDCICMYDVNMVLSGITPGTYNFIIRNGNYPNGFPKMKWTVDLLKNPTGEVCATYGGD